MKHKKLFSMALIVVICLVFLQSYPAAAQEIIEVECPCKGGVISFTLKNLTGSAQHFRMWKDGQEIYFDGDVPAEGLFTGTNGGATFHGGDTTIRIGDAEPYTEFIIHTSCSQPLNVGMLFGTVADPALVQVAALESMDGGVCPAVCLPNTVSGSPTLTYASKTATWNITHTSLPDDWLMLDSMKLNWPSSNGNLVKISFDGNIIWTGNASDPFSNSTWDAGTELARTLKAGATVGITVEFENNAATPSTGDGYYFSLVFYGTDCGVNAAKVVSFGEASTSRNPVPVTMLLGGLLAMLAVGYVTLMRRSTSITSKG